MDPYQTIDRVLDYIESQLDQEIRIDTLSKSVHLSKYHFQRLFKSVVGQPVAQYIKQRRLAEAALALKQSSHSVLEIAIDHGFHSSEVFSRSFLGLANCTPTAYRRSDVVVPYFAKPNLLTKRLKQESMGKLYDWQEVELPAIKLIGLQGVSDLQPQDPKISQLWQTLIGTLDTLPNIVQPDIHYSLLCDELTHSHYQFFAGIETSAFTLVPAHFVMRCLPAHRYMRFTHVAPSHHGFTDSLDNTMALIYSSWRSLTDKALAEIGIDLMVRTDEASLSAKDRDAIVELYVPITAESADRSH